MHQPAQHQDLRAQLAALTSDEAELRKDLEDLTSAALAEEAAAMAAVQRGDESAARQHLEAHESIRTEGAVIEAEIRVIMATVSSYREALEAFERSAPQG